MARKAYIDGCVGCGLCVQMFPEIFSMEDAERANFKEGQDHESPAVSEAADLCPASGIMIEGQAV